MYVNMYMYIKYVCFFYSCFYEYLFRFKWLLKVYFMNIFYKKYYNRIIMVKKYSRNIKVMIDKYCYV